MTNQFSSDVDSGGDAGDPFSANGSASGGPEPPEPPSLRDGLNAAQVRAAMPKLWIGYLLCIAIFTGEGIAVARNPELLKPQTQFTIPPLEIFLPVFIAGVYWLVCIYNYHKILANIPGYKHPVSPARAVGFHFIPFFYLVWLFIWPNHIAKYVNARAKPPRMRGWIVGLTSIAGIASQIFVDPAFGCALEFLGLTYLASCLVRALTTVANPETPSP